MKSSFEALSREFGEKNMIVKLQNSLEDTSVHNMFEVYIYPVPVCKH